MCVRGGGEGRWGGCKALVPGYFDKLPGYARERLNVLDGTPWQLRASPAPQALLPRRHVAQI